MAKTKKPGTGRKGQGPLKLAPEYHPGWLDEADKRTNRVRGVMNVRSALEQDLGGAANLSVQKQMIIDRAIFLCLRITTLETTVLNGEDIEWSHYAFLANSLMGHLKTLGLERQIKNLGSLKEYMEAEE